MQQRVALTHDRALQDALWARSGELVAQLEAKEAAALAAPLEVLSPRKEAEMVIVAEPAAPVASTSAIKSEAAELNDGDGTGEGQ